MGDYQYVFTLETFGDQLHAAGNFIESGDRILYSTARWNAPSWEPMGAGTNDEVTVLCSGPDGLYAGGAFKGAGDAPSWRVAHWVADVSGVAPSPVGLALDLHMPNPYRPGDAIRLSVLPVQRVDVAVYDVDGRRLARLSSRGSVEGPLELRWDGRANTGRALPVGLYCLSVSCGVARTHTGFMLAP